MVLGIAYQLFQMLASGNVFDDDSSDRLSYRITVSILIISSILIGTKQLVGDPITCWIPAHFTGNHEHYTNSYCWVRNTYYLPWDNHIPKEHENDQRYMITYYQWIPLILMVQALFFYMPRLLWVGLNKRVGMDVNLVMSNAVSLQNSQKYDEYSTILANMSYHMHRMFKRDTTRHKLTVSIKSCLSRVCCDVIGRRKGNYLIVLFLAHKLLYIANLLAQMFVLNYVLGFNFNMYGFEVLKSLAQGREWADTPFPRVTMCDMKIRRLGNVHRYAVQCVLPINLYTEKLYLFQWFWFIALLTMSCIEFVQWTFRILVWHKNRENYIKKHLDLAKTHFDKDMVVEHADEFADEYLKQDGVFLLRLIAKNVSQGVTCMLTQELWKLFVPWYKNKHPAIEDDLPEKPRHGYDPETLPLRSRTGRN